MGFQTPNTLPTDTVCRTIRIPDDEGFIAVVTGALQTLIFPESWTQYGTDTPEQAADLCAVMLDDFVFSRAGCKMIGEIILWPLETSPSSDWIACDGSSLLRVIYPDLFVVIGTIYGAIDSEHFSVPDLRSRSVIGVGMGNGLSSYSIGDIGGEEQHTLTSAETPSHSHSDSGHVHSEISSIPAVGAAIVGVPIPSAIPSVASTGVGFANIGNSGGDGAHNNMVPYLALNYLIVAR